MSEVIHVEFKAPPHEPDLDAIEVELRNLCEWLWEGEDWDNWAASNVAFHMLQVARFALRRLFDHTDEEGVLKHFLNEASWVSAVCDGFDALKPDIKRRLGLVCEAGDFGVSTE